MEKTLYSRDHEIFLDLLKETRIRAEVTQEELARRLQKTQSFVSRIERGERRLDILELRVVLQGLNVSVVDFVARLDQSLTRKK